MVPHFIRTSHPGAIAAGLGVAMTLLLFMIDALVGGSPWLVMTKWTPLILVAIGVFVLLTTKNKWNLVYTCPGCGWRGPLKRLVPVAGDAQSYACPSCGSVAGAARDDEDDEAGQHGAAGSGRDG